MRISRVRRWKAAWTSALGLLLGLGGCGGDSTGVSAPPDVQLTVASRTVAIVAGEEEAVHVTIRRPDGVTSAVTLEVLGTPAGVTAEVAMNPVSTDTATVTLRVEDGAASGSYPITLRGSGAGLHAGVATLELQVMLRRELAVTIPYCTGLAPIWVAFQDGDGSWSRGDAEVGDGITTFRHAFSADHGAVATVVPILNGAITLVSVLYGEPDELVNAGDTTSIDCTAVASRTLRGTVAGLHQDEKALVSTGLLLRTSVLSTAPDFFLSGIPASPQDMLVSREVDDANGPLVNGFILRRNLEAPDGAALPPFDVSSMELFAPATATLPILGAGAEDVFSLTEVHTANSQLTVPFLVDQLGATTRPYFALPEDRLLPGDLQKLHLSTAADENGTNRTADAYFRSPVDRTMALGAPLVPPTVGVTVSGGSLLPRVTFVPQAGYDQATTVLFEQAVVPTLVSVTMTEAYAAGRAGGYSLAIPDLGTVAGFDPAWSLRPGSAVLWSATRTGGTVPFGRNQRPADGAVQQSAFLRGTLPAS
jgi:hypothetical protein